MGPLGAHGMPYPGHVRPPVSQQQLHFVPPGPGGVANIHPHGNYFGGQQAPPSAVEGLPSKVTAPEERSGGVGPADAITSSGVSGVDDEMDLELPDEMEEGGGEVEDAGLESGEGGGVVEEPGEATEREEGGQPIVEGVDEVLDTGMVESSRGSGEVGSVEGEGVTVDARLEAEEDVMPSEVGLAGEEGVAYAEGVAPSPSEEQPVHTSQSEAEEVSELTTDMTTACDRDIPPAEEGAEDIDNVDMGIDEDQPYADDQLNPDEYQLQAEQTFGNENHRLTLVTSSNPSL